MVVLCRPRNTAAVRVWLQRSIGGPVGRAQAEQVEHAAGVASHGRADHQRRDDVGLSARAEFNAFGI